MGDYAVDGTKMKFAPCGTPGCQTVGEFQLRLGEQLQPLFKKYGVDLYNAGHVHSYESTWPLCDFTKGALCRDSNGTWLQSLDEPRGTVHITEGNGGVPGVPGTFSAKSCTVPPPAGDGGATAAKGGGWPGCHMTGTGGAYGRIAATPTTLTCKDLDACPGRSNPAYSYQALHLGMQGLPYSPRNQAWYV